MATIIIDATDAIAGRLAAFAAKHALLGYQVRVINSEKAVVSGAPRATLSEASRHYKMGVPRKGPYHSRLPDRYLRRIIRGMLPHKFPRGKAAYKRILCYIGTPVEFQQERAVKVPGADKSKLPNVKYVTIGRIVKELGGKHYE